MKDKVMRGRIFKERRVAFVVFAFASMASYVACAAELTVEFAEGIGSVKPVHSVGQGPLLGKSDFSMFRYLNEAGVPYARLHDVGGAFGGNLFVDIPNLFRDFDADENDPANYDFAFTDLYLKALVDNGVEPYFRLGVTIEVFARTVKAYRIFPPKDFAKWARICEHVIRHYTEGWADGYRWKIAYWEIWNEADDFPDNRNAMWRGTWRQFCEFYEVASKHLKSKFPHLNIGGYGKCTAHNVTFEMKGESVPEEEAYRHRCFVEFCDFIKERSCPLDFFSFHGYITPDLVKPHTDYHRELLRKAGYGNAELHLNEWLCGDTSGAFWKRASLASGIAAFIVAAQITDGLDMANIYDARCDAMSRYAPLFDPIEKKPGKAFYALRCFNELYRLGTAVKCNVTGGQGVDGLWASAARGEKGAAVFVVNDSPSARKVTTDFGAKKVLACHITDAERTDVEIENPQDCVPMTPHSFALLLFD